MTPQINIFPKVKEMSVLVYYNSELHHKVEVFLLESGKSPIFPALYYIGAVKPQVVSFTCAVTLTSPPRDEDYLTPHFAVARSGVKAP